jgi:predicted phage terminase large subunit-like protein
LAEFTRQAWGVVEPATLTWGWHIDCIAEHLQAVSAGQLKKLLICIPPRHTKSTIVSVLWPCWEWCTRPELQWLFASHSEPLAIRDLVKARRLILSSWYQHHWPTVKPAADQNEKRRIDLEAGGHRLALGVGSSITGQGGDRLIVDDAHNVAEAESEAVRNSVLDWHDAVWSTRANNPATTSRIVIGQRVHSRDLIAHLIEQGGWELLSLPAEYDGRKYVTSVGWSDPRTEPGELLWPQRFGPEQIEDAKRMLGSYAYSAQFQQQPAPPGGGMLKKSWFRFYTEVPAGLTNHMLSLDCAFKETQTSDFVVCQCWAKKGADRFLLDQFRKRTDFVGTVQALKMMAARWPEASLKLVESKANGDAVISSLKHEISGIVPFNPRESKEARVSAIAPQVEAGNVYIPHPSIAPWIDDDFLLEVTSFPVGANDDAVDAMSQALAHMSELIRTETSTLYFPDGPDGILLRAVKKHPPKPEPKAEPPAPPQDPHTKQVTGGLYRG